MKQLLHGMRRAAPLPLAALAAPCAAFLLSAAALGGQFSPWALAAVAAAGTGWNGAAAVAGVRCWVRWHFWTSSPACATARRRCSSSAPTRPSAPPACTAATGFAPPPPCWRPPWCRRPTCGSGRTPVGAVRRGPGPAVWLHPAVAAEAGRPGRYRPYRLVFAAAGRLRLPQPPVAVRLHPGHDRRRRAAAGAGPRRPPLADLICAGALAGLTLDLCAVDTFYASVVLALAAAAHAAARTLPPILSAAAFCTGGVCGAWLLGDVQPLALLCELIVASGLYLLLPATPTACLPAPDMAAAPAAAFQAVYDSLPAEAPALRARKPCGAIRPRGGAGLPRLPPSAPTAGRPTTPTPTTPSTTPAPAAPPGKPLAEDFPAYFATRCVRFPRLLSALEEQLRASSSAVPATPGWMRPTAWPASSTPRCPRCCPPANRRCPGPSPTPAVPPLAARPKKGDPLRRRGRLLRCGRQDLPPAVRRHGQRRRCPSRGRYDRPPVRQFLTAGVDPTPALKTLNTALMLRCQGGAGFTTIDLACMDGVPAWSPCISTAPRPPT